MKIIDEVYPLIKCEARLSDDGTLWIKTDTKSAEQTKRVLIEYAENSFCKTFYQDCDEPSTIPTFTESEEAYKAWTGEEMGKTSDEINEMNNEIIKDILKMMPTAYLLEALGVSTFEELTEQADRPIKAIQDCRNCKYGKYNERYSEYFCYHNGECVNYDLWESGEEIADRPHGEWIPIATEPNTSDHVLVTYKWDGDDYEASELDYWVTEYEAEKGNEKCKWLIDHVIAWMPIPKPYKGGDDE